MSNFKGYIFVWNYSFLFSFVIGLGGVSDMDNLTYTTLGYYNGPGYREEARKENLTEEQVREYYLKQNMYE